MSHDDTLLRIEALLETRKGASADGSYVASLYAKGIDAILKKVGEESAETIIAAKGGDRLAIVKETADLWFHSMVMLAHANIRIAEVLDELARREGISGLVEKASRGQQET